LALAVAVHLARPDVAVADVLRWAEPRASAHGYATARYPEQLYPNLRLVRLLPTHERVVLVDDVLTTGGHMRAVAAFLTDAGAEVIGGVCGECSDDGEIADAFAPRLERLEPFQYDARLIDEWPEQAGRARALRAAEGAVAYVTGAFRKNSTSSS
jgi:hypothetical protein